MNTHTPWYKTTLTFAALPAVALLISLIGAYGNSGFAMPTVIAPFVVLPVIYAIFQMKRDKAGVAGETLIAGGALYFAATLISSIIIGIAGGTPFGFFIMFSVFSGFLVLIGFLQKIAAKK